MPYEYVAYTTEKKIIKGTVNVATEGLAEEALEREGYQLLSLKQVKPGLEPERLFPTFFGVKSRAMLAFSRHLATLLESGVPFTTALSLLGEHTTSTPLKRVIAGLLLDVRGGSSFSQALAKYPHVFPHIYRMIVGSGEKTGKLEFALRQAVSYLERGMTAKEKALRAMIYPAMVIFLAIGVLVLLVSVALPPLVGLFSAFGAQLPLAPRLLLAFVSFITHYKLYLVGVVFTLVILFSLWIRQPTSRLILDNLVLKIPLVGSLIVQSNVALFARTMSVLLKSGLPLPEIMDTICQTTGNRVICQSLKDVRKKVVEGHGMSGPMAANKLFPRLLVEMIMVGEQTGTLDSNLSTMADFYDNEVSQKIEALISALEPALTVVIGVVVGFIALSLVMPMYSIMAYVK